MNCTALQSLCVCCKTSLNFSKLLCSLLWWLTWLCVHVNTCVCCWLANHYRSPLQSYGCQCCYWHLDLQVNMLALWALLLLLVLFMELAPLATSCWLSHLHVENRVQSTCTLWISHWGTVCVCEGGGGSVSNHYSSTGEGLRCFISVWGEGHTNSKGCILYLWYW